MAKDKEYEVLNKSVINYCKPQLKTLDITKDDLVLKLMHNHKLVEVRVEGHDIEGNGKLKWAVTRVHTLSK